MNDLDWLISILAKIRRIPFPADIECFCERVAILIDSGQSEFEARLYAFRLIFVPAEPTPRPFLWSSAGSTLGADAAELHKKGNQPHSLRLENENQPHSLRSISFDLLVKEYFSSKATECGFSGKNVWASNTQTNAGVPSKIAINKRDYLAR